MDSATWPLAAEDEGRTVLHAALGNGDVRFEDLASVLQEYAYLGARRLVRFAEASTVGPVASESVVCDPAGIDLARPETLRGACVHVVGVAGAEGAAIVRFLVEHGVTTVTAHDFSTPESFEKNFRLSHVGLKPRERGSRLREMLAMPIRLCYRDRYLEGIEQAPGDLPAPGLVPVRFQPTGARLAGAGGDIVFSHMTDLYFRLAACRIAAVHGHQWQVHHDPPPV